MRRRVCAFCCGFMVCCVRSCVCCVRVVGIYVTWGKIGMLRPRKKVTEFAVNGLPRGMTVVHPAELAIVALDFVLQTIASVSKTQWARPVRCSLVAGRACRIPESRSTFLWIPAASPPCVSGWLGPDASPGRFSWSVEFSGSRKPPPPRSPTGFEVFPDRDGHGAAAWALRCPSFVVE